MTVTKGTPIVTVSNARSPGLRRRLPEAAGRRRTERRSRTWRRARADPRRGRGRRRVVRRHRGGDRGVRRPAAPAGTSAQSRHSPTPSVRRWVGPRAAVDSGWYPARLPGRPDRQDHRRAPATVRRCWHLRRNPAPAACRPQSDRRAIDGRRGPDLRARRLRRGRRPARSPPGRHRRC